MIDTQQRGRRTFIPTENRVDIGFPRGCHPYTAEEFIPDIKKRIAGHESVNLKMDDIKFNEGATADNQYWSMPLVNVSDPQVDGRVNNEAVIDDAALQGVIQSTSLLNIEDQKALADHELDQALLPPPSEHSYGNLLVPDGGGGFIVDIQHDFHSFVLAYGLGDAKVKTDDDAYNKPPAWDLGGVVAKTEGEGSGMIFCQQVEFDTRSRNGGERTRRWLRKRLKKERQEMKLKEKAAEKESE